MSAEELADFNERLASPPEFDLADSDAARPVRRLPAGRQA